MITELTLFTCSHVKSLHGYVEQLCSSQNLIILKFITGRLHRRCANMQITENVSNMHDEGLHRLKVMVFKILVCFY